MNLKLFESFVELIELGVFANNQDIVKGLNSAIKVTKEQAELTDEEISEVFKDCTKDGILDANEFAKAILRKAQEK
jgi:Ca2+-binding EF-hand superfamily protein